MQGPRVLQKHEVICHTHLVKTSGSYFNRLFHDAFGYDSCILMTDNPHAMTNYITMRQAGKLRLLSDHTHYGFHQWFNITHPYYFCVLRHPAHRLYSQYHFARATLKPGSNLEAILTMSFEEYILKRPGRLTNLMCHFISLNSLKESKRTLLNRLLTQYGMFLIHERLEESAPAIKRCLGVDYSSDYRVNDTDYEEPNWDEVRKIVAQTDADDIELYEMANDIYGQYLQTEHTVNAA